MIFSFQQSCMGGLGGSTRSLFRTGSQHCQRQWPLSRPSLWKTTLAAKDTCRCRWRLRHVWTWCSTGCAGAVVGRIAGR